jgi:hypothetical protein
MPRKKKKSSFVPDAFRKHKVVFRTVLDVLEVVSFVLMVLSLVYPNMFVINYIKHERTINLDVTNAYVHPSDSVKLSDSVTVTIQNSSGTFTLYGS